MGEKDEWYGRFIEEPIREVVRLLRDNGFNTTCSCGHEMTVEGDFSLDGEAQRLANLLVNAGVQNSIVEITIITKGGWVLGNFRVRLPCSEETP